MLWLTQIALAGMFLFVGGLKLTGTPELVGLFERSLLPSPARLRSCRPWRSSLPAWAAFGALLLIPTMVGAVFTHLFIVGGSAVPATVLLIGALAIAWARRDQLRGGAERLPFGRIGWSSSEAHRCSGQPGRFAQEVKAISSRGARSPRDSDRHGNVASRRLGAPEDIAGMVAFLFSDDGAYVNGQMILVDGGAHLTGASRVAIHIALAFLPEGTKEAVHD